MPFEDSRVRIAAWPQRSLRDQSGCPARKRRANFGKISQQEIIMTKAELIEDVSRLVEMSRKDSEVIVETIFDSIVKSLKAGDKIEIRGFGSFRTRQRKPRIGRNPKTGTRVDVPAKKIPYFKPSKELKDLVNSSQATEAPAAPPAVPPEAPTSTTP
jgi:integration host factor subunit beta